MTTLEKLKDLYEEFPDELVKAAIDEIEKLSRDKKHLYGAVVGQRNHIKELRREMQEAGIWKRGKLMKVKLSAPRLQASA